MLDFSYLAFINHYNLDFLITIFLFSISGGYESVQKVATTIKKVNNVILKLIKDYNGLVGENQQITFDDAKDPSSHLYSHMPSISAVPYNLQRRAVDSLCLLTRAKEESMALKKELYGLLQYHQNLKDFLISHLENFSASSSPPLPPSTASLESAKCAIVVRHIVRIEQMQLLLAKTASSLFQDDINISLTYLEDVWSSGLVASECQDDDDDNELHLHLDTSDDEEYVFDDDDVPTDDEMSDFAMQNLWNNSFSSFWKP